MAIGDVYQVTVKQRVNNNDAFNVWYCRSVAEPANAEGIAVNFVDSVIPLMRLQQSQLLEYYEVSARNLFDNGDKFDEGISITGAIASTNQVMPLHDAVGFTLLHDNANIRNGAKRLAGIMEGQNNSFGVLNTVSVTELDDMMNDVIQRGVAEPQGGSLFQQIAEFVIVKSIPVIVEGVTGYRLPESAVEAVIGVIESAIVKPNMSTQLSRKQGVGS